MRKLLTFFAVHALLVMCIGPALAENEDLVVMLEVRLQDDPFAYTVGAGLIAHQDEASAVIVTAAHNVPETMSVGSADGDEKVYIEYLAAPGKKFETTLLYLDRDLDLAVLSATSSQALAAGFEANRRALMPEGLPHSLDDGVFAIGQPGRRAWFGNRRPEAVLSFSSGADPRLIEYKSGATVEGMSGGGLFSEHNALIGVVIHVDQVARAIRIDEIGRILRSENIAFSLQENGTVTRSIASAQLRALNLDSTVGLARNISAAEFDFGALHLYWLSDFPADKFESVLAEEADGKNISRAHDLFVRNANIERCKTEFANPRIAKIVGNAAQDAGFDIAALSCNDHFSLWLREHLKRGVNANLITAASQDESKALLASALETKNAVAAMALLANNASPNPYVDLDGKYEPVTSFVDPLSFVLRDFEGLDQENLISALKEAGVRAGVKQNFGNVKVSFEQGKPLSETDSDRVCSNAKIRDGFDWCTYLRSLPRTIQFKNNDPYTKGTGLGYASSTHTLFIGDEVAYLLGSYKFGYGDDPEPVVIAVTKGPGQWHVYWHDDKYGCRERKDGSAPSYCWRKYEAFAASFNGTSDRKSLSETLPSKLAARKVATTSVANITLATPLPAALDRLAAQGFERTRKGRLADYRNTGISLELRAAGESIKIVAFNDEILALEYQGKGGANDMASLKQEFDEQQGSLLQYDFREREGYSKFKHLYAVEEFSEGVLALIAGQFPDRPNYQYSLILVKRSPSESPMEFSFMEGVLDRWGISKSDKKTSQGKCLDKFHRIRIRPDETCLTIDE